MAKFKESELIENLIDYQKKSTIQIKFEKSLEGKIELEEATVKYDEKRGYINIESKESNFKINTTLVYGYESKNEEIYIDLETVLLIIRKIGK